MVSIGAVSSLAFLVRASEDGGQEAKKPGGKVVDYTPVNAPDNVNVCEPRELQAASWESFVPGLLTFYQNDLGIPQDRLSEIIKNKAIIDSVAAILKTANSEALTPFAKMNNWTGRIADWDYANLLASQCEKRLLVGNEGYAPALTYNVGLLQRPIRTIFSWSRHHGSLPSFQAPISEIKVIIDEYLNPEQPSPVAKPIARPVAVPRETVSDAGTRNQADAGVRIPPPVQAPVPPAPAPVTVTAEECAPKKRIPNKDKTKCVPCDKGFEFKSAGECKKIEVAPTPPPAAPALPDCACSQIKDDKMQETCVNKDWQPKKIQTYVGKDKCKAE